MLYTQSDKMDVGYNMIFITNQICSSKHWSSAEYIEDTIDKHTQHQQWRRLENKYTGKENRRKRKLKDDTETKYAQIRATHRN